MTERTVVALVSAPSGFAGMRTSLLRMIGVEGGERVARHAGTRRADPAAAGGGAERAGRGAAGPPTCVPMPRFGLIAYSGPEIRDHIARVWCEAWLAHRPDSDPQVELRAARALLR
ncbi:hypothetical protein [Lentzea nigeriaca]|uniref:hypothetical protein n=1 Tax=Lentzea nigeriaca TaxID=1128665 RepID=UPI001957A2F9|nr:hypothetical protein [Lentzea nigeriaca]MBM7860359.1 hypothetical protein [Lentzea nigeriaca]